MKIPLYNLDEFEISEQKVEREHLLSSLDAAKVRIADLEALLAKKV